VEGTIESTGTLTIGEHACIRGEIRTKSVELQGTVEGNIFVTDRCELHAGCTLRGDIEAPRLVVNDNVTFLGMAKVGKGKSLPAWRSPVEPNAVSNAISYAKHRSCSHDAVIRAHERALCIDSINSFSEADRKL
jgi:cytoskeletal protein CcmA (bactofilin family)